MKSHMINFESTDQTLDHPSYVSKTDTINELQDLEKSIKEKRA